MCLLAVDFQMAMVRIVSLEDRAFVSVWYRDADCVLNFE